MLMSVQQVRNWLGMFFLGTTALMGAYIILFQETVALPISSKDATSAFQIIIPTFIAQIATIFRWISNPGGDDNAVAVLPRWAVIGPPVLVLLILGVTIGLLMIDAGGSLNGGTIFKNAVTLCVSLLGASTVFIVARVFTAPGSTVGRRRGSERRSRGTEAL
jgi:hypothetical protein